MKKVFILILAALLTAGVLTGCGGGADSAASSAQTAPAEKTYNLLIGTHLLLGMSMVDVYQWMENELRDKSNGRFNVSLSHSAQLGSQREIQEAVQNGLIEFSQASSAALVTYGAEECMIPTLPYLFESVEHFMQTRPAFVPHMAKSLEQKTNLVLLTATTGPARSCFLTKPVRKFDDFKGLKIRTPENRGLVEAMKALGANPTPVSAPEMYTAIQTGVVDGAENQMEAIWAYKLHEVTKYAVMTKHTFCDEYFFSYKDFINSLDPASLKLLQDVSEQAAQMYANLTSSGEDEYIKLMKDYGIEFIEVDLAPYREAVQGFWNEIIASVPAAESMVEGVQAAAVQ